MHLWSPRHAHIWLPGYLRARMRQSGRTSPAGPTHILFCVADHFEPDHGRASADRERSRVARWVTEYAALATEFRDATGRPPQHTFFFPIEMYRREHLDRLARLCAAGFGDVELHLHHGRDTSANLRSLLTRMTSILACDHGLLGRYSDGRIAYGFVHGNWALDNGGLDGSTCGVNDEITVLRETGCFADFTMPACPDPAQSRIVNAIYRTRDDPSLPRSYDRGRRACAGRLPDADEFLLIEGPLSVWWPGRGRLLPRIDSGTLDATPANWPTLERFRRWVSCHISVEGRPEWIFVKVHTHGAPEKNADVLLGQVMRHFHRDLAAHFNDGQTYCLHYVTAREMYNIVAAAEAGRSGNPSDYRDFAVRRSTAPVT